MAPPRRIPDLTRRELREIASKAGERPFRAGQIFEWVHGRGVLDPAGWSNVPKPLRDLIRRDFPGPAPRPVWTEDPKSTTDKLYMAYGDDGVEAVLIHEDARTTVCLSSQMGCPVGCRFCASGLLGLKRNLTTGEILEQFHEARARSLAKGKRVSNIVMMGMGEPLLNYDAVMDALDVLHDPAGGGIGARHIAISTVGLRKGVERLLSDNRPYTVAFSLHAPDDALRRELIPFPGAMDVAELAAAARAYLEGKGREVTFEYVLLHGVNSTPAHARRLADLLRGVRCTVNAIPYNPNPGLDFQRPPPAVVDAFVEILRSRRVRVSVRKRKGGDILAACGQLRLRRLADGSAPADPAR